MLGFVRKKSATVAPDWASDPKRDREVAKEVARSGWLPNFAPRDRNRKRKPMPRGVSRESRRPLANSRKGKIARSPQWLVGFHASFPRLRAAQTSRQSTVKATMVQETDAPPPIANGAPSRESVRTQSAVPSGLLIALHLAKAIHPSLAKSETSTTRL